MSSEYNVSSMSTERIIDLCKKTGADTYLSGAGGKDYMDVTLFEKNIGKIRSKARTDIHYEVEVSLEVTQESDVEIELTYQCNGAQWIPSYDVDLLPGEAKLRRIAMENKN